ncbi:hypothetical protein AURDEDRAFT_160622 [Auricularia subglabra TFB-10046 SS5]|nr:hypothetical protein AURDEDRAFT_160622 [Auricularia subglabra TFB-10046 SS5]
MSNTEQEINDLRQQGFRPLCEDQFRPPPPQPPRRIFPQEMNRRTIPPVKGQVLDKTKTPLYVLGWPTTAYEFEARYGPRCETYGLANVQDALRDLWHNSVAGTENDAYKDYGPDVIHQDFEGNYILAIVGNYNEEHLRQSLLDGYIETMMSFLGRTDQPKWIRL